MTISTRSTLDTIHGEYEYNTEVLQAIAEHLNDMLETAPITDEPQALLQILLMERGEAVQYTRVICDYLRKVNKSNNELNKVVDKLFHGTDQETQGTA